MIFSDIKRESLVVYELDINKALKIRIHAVTSPFMVNEAWNIFVCYITL